MHCCWESLLFLLTSVSFVKIPAAAEESVSLYGVVGRNLTLPDPVWNNGIFKHGSNIVGRVNQGNFTFMDETYTNKVYWNSSNGLFTLIDLQHNESGSYIIDPKKEGALKTYNVTVYDPVPTPVIQRLNRSGNSCLLECLVQSQTNLQIIKDDQTVNESKMQCSLQISVQETDFNSTYKCVASTRAENKTEIINVPALCREETSEPKDNQRIPIAAVIAAVIVVVLLLIAAVIGIGVCIRINRRRNQATEQRRPAQPPSGENPQGGMEMQPLRQQPEADQN